MLELLKGVGYCLLAIVVLSLALGIGAALTALSGVLGLIALGGGTLFIIILVVKDFFETRK